MEKNQGILRSRSSQLQYFGYISCSDILTEGLRWVHDQIVINNIRKFSQEKSSMQCQVLRGYQYIFLLALSTTFLHGKLTYQFLLLLLYWYQSIFVCFSYCSIYHTATVAGCHKNVPPSLHMQSLRDVFKIKKKESVENSTGAGGGGQYGSISTLLLKCVKCL